MLASGDPARHGKGVRVVQVIHLLVLLIAPVVVAGSVILNVLQPRIDTYHLQRQAVWLAIFGYVFHTGIASLLLQHVFGFHAAIKTARLQYANLPDTSLRRLLALGLGLLGPPVFTTVAIIFIGQQSMMATPFFLSQKTTASALVESLKEGLPSLLERSVATAAAASCIAALIASGLVIPVITARWLARGLLSRQPASSPSVRTTKDPSLFFRALLIGATIPHVLVVVAAILVSAPLMGDANDWWHDAARVLSTITSPPTLFGLAMGVFASVLVIFIRYRLPLRAPRLSTIAACSALAFTPPALLGTVVLVVSAHIPHKLALASVLGIYAFASSLLCMSHALSGMDYPELLNARLANTRTRQFAAILLATPLTAILPFCLVGPYVIWVEEGIQVSADSPYPSLAKALWDRDGTWSHGTMVGVFAAFGVWLSVWAFAMVLSRFRMFIARRLISFASPALSNRMATLLLVSSVAFSFALGHPAAASSQSKIAGAPVDVDIDSRSVIDPSGRVDLPPEPALSLRLSVGQRTNGALVLRVAPQTRQIEIASLQVLHARPASVYIEGTSGGITQQLYYLGVSNLSSSTPQGEPLELHIAGLEILTFEANDWGFVGIPSSASPIVSSTFSGPASLVFDTGASASRIQMSRMMVDSVSIALPTGDRTSKCTLIGVKARTISLRGEAATNASVPQRATIQIQMSDVTLGGNSAQPSRLSLQDLSLAAGDISITARSTSIAALTASTPLMFDLLNSEIVGTSDVYVTVADADAVDFQLRSVDLRGRLTINAESQSVLTLVVADLHGMGGAGLASLKVKSHAIGHLTIDTVSLKELELVSDGRTLEPSIGSLRGLAVRDNLSVTTTIFDAIAASEGQPRVAYRPTMDLLQSNGVLLTENGSSSRIGLKALFERKFAELSSIHPIAAYALLCMTGLGIQLWLPLVSFVAVLFLYLLSSTIVFHRSVKTGTAASRNPVLDAVKTALTFLLIDRPKAPDDATVEWKILIALRAGFRFFVFVQVTMLGLYLGHAVS